jgi:hypothetical protein
MLTGRARTIITWKQGQRNPTSVSISDGGAVGVFERGPFTLTPITSPAEFQRYFGGVFSGGYCKVPQLIKDAFGLGLRTLYIQRTAHYNDPADPASLTAKEASVALPSAGIAATAASVTSTGAPTYALTNGDDLDVDIGAGAVNVVFDAAPAQRDSAPGGGWPIADQDGNTITVKINRGTVQTVTFSGVTQTAASVAAQMNTHLTGCRVYESGGEVRIETDREGLAAYIEVTGGTANAAINFNVAEVQGTSTAGIDDILAVTNAEIKDAIEATAGLIGAVTVTDNGTTFTIATVATGAAAEITISGGTARTTLGLVDGTTHTGTAAGALTAATLTGKYEGTYAHAYTPVVSAASNGSADYFNVAFVKGGIAQETFVNLSAVPTNARFAETIINADGTGSTLFTWADGGLYGTYTATQARPNLASHTAPSGGSDGTAGLVDADFVGDPAGHTGLYGFDTARTLRMFTVPGRASATIHAAINTYRAYSANTLDREIYALHPTPFIATVATASAMETWATSYTFGTDEMACAPAWPPILIANPNTTVFGDSATIEVDPVLYKMARFCNVDDNHPDSTWASCAGVDWGTIPNCLGYAVADTELTPGWRDRLADVNVECINKDVGTDYYFDGGDNCKTTGDWPRQWHVRAAIRTAETIKASWIWVKHSKNTSAMRTAAGKQALAWLATTPQAAYEASTGAEDPTIPAGAPLYYVDVSDALNPIAVRKAGEFRAEVGLGYVDDAKYTTITITRATVAG